MIYSMYIIDQESDTLFDVSELAYDITHSTSLQGQPGKLTFNLKKDPNNILTLSMGSLVLFRCNDVPVFKGNIFTIKTNRTQDYTITAYDKMRYLQNHHYLMMSGYNLKSLFQKICTDIKIGDYKILGKAKTLNSSDNLEDYFFNDVSYFDILQHAINETNNHYISEKVQNADGTISILYDTDVAKQQIPYKFFIRDNFGVLELNDIENNVKYRQTGIEGDITRAWTGNEWYYYDESRREQLEPLIIGDESLLTDYEYEVDIDKNTYTQIVLMETLKETSETKNKDKTNMGLALVAPSKDILPELKSNINKWGVLRKIVNLKTNYTNASQSEKERIEQYLKLALTESSQVSKTLKINALGYNGVNAGDGFMLRLKKLGIDKMMYVISATHYYNADKHTMSLEVSTSKNLTEIL